MGPIEREAFSWITRLHRVSSSSGGDIYIGCPVWVCPFKLFAILSPCTTPWFVQFFNASLDIRSRFESSSSSFEKETEELNWRKRKRRRERVVKYRKGHGSIVVHCERVQLRRTISSETLETSLVASFSSRRRKSAFVSWPIAGIILRHGEWVDTAFRKLENRLNVFFFLSRFRMNLTRQSGKICSNIKFLAIHRSLQIKLFGELKQDKGYYSIPRFLSLMKLNLNWLITRAYRTDQRN